MKALGELGISNPPWSVWHVSKSRVKNANGNSIADCGGLIDYIVADAKINEAISNASLIAAAPELYEALELCERKLDAIEPYGELLVQVRAALAKASGEEVTKAVKESEEKE